MVVVVVVVVVAAVVVVVVVAVVVDLISVEHNLFIAPVDVTNMRP